MSDSVHAIGLGGSGPPAPPRPPSGPPPPPPGGGAGAMPGGGAEVIGVPPFAACAICTSAAGTRPCVCSRPKFAVSARKALRTAAYFLLAPVHRTCARQASTTQEHIQRRATAKNA